VLVLAWVLLLLLAVGLVVLVGLRAFRKFRALLRELGGVAQLLDAAADGRAPSRDPTGASRTYDGRSRRTPGEDVPSCSERWSPGT
jgi:hypothetical protein